MNLKENLTLKDRTYICEKCGAEIDRDLNASLNICYEGMKLYMKEIYGCRCSVSYIR